MSNTPAAFSTFSSGKTITNLPRSSSPVQFNDELGIAGKTATFDQDGIEKVGSFGSEKDNYGGLSNAFSSGDLEAGSERSPSLLVRRLTAYIPP